MKKSVQTDEISIYWDGDDLTIEPYHSKKKVYFCGKELLTFKEHRTKIYTILVLDVEDCCCADVYTTGEIKVRFQEHSQVPHKHRKGGQSQQRFQRIRDNEITLWYKRINEYLKTINSDKIYLGINPIYKKRFLNTLSTYNQEKINRVTSTEYANITGVYQYVNKLENGLVA